MSTVENALRRIKSRGIIADANLGERLLKQGIWRAASPTDVYINQAEKAGDTPFAYTLSPGKKPIAIVLAGRFFTDATPLGQAALMIHELGHYQAYVLVGRSDEYDGYKPEYDLHTQLGLTEKDGLVYFSMLDGVVEYVVPRAPNYATKPDVKQFMTE
jgi:hypothetical protein